MKIAVIYPQACTESARKLAKAIGADCYNGYKQHVPRGYDILFNYGVSHHENTRAKMTINEQHRIHVCRNKVETFKVLQKTGVRIPIFFTKREDIPKRHGTIVVRAIVDGCQNEGMKYIYQGENIPEAPLYTQYIEHRAEYRIVVFMGKIVGRYHKQENPDNPGNYQFQLMHKAGFKMMDKDCLTAAKALGIDYVGFDVLENDRGDHFVLEANSGPILLPDVEEAIKKYFKQLTK